MVMRERLADFLLSRAVATDDGSWGWGRRAIGAEKAGVAAAIWSEWTRLNQAACTWKLTTYDLLDHYSSHDTAVLGTVVAPADWGWCLAAAQRVLTARAGSDDGRCYDVTVTLVPRVASFKLTTGWRIRDGRKYLASRFVRGLRCHPLASRFAVPPALPPDERCSGQHVRLSRVDGLRERTIFVGGRGCCRRRRVRVELPVLEFLNGETAKSLGAHAQFHKMMRS